MGRAKALAVAALFAVSGCDTQPVPEPEDPYSEAAFRTWLSADDDRAAEYERFARFLADHGVADVVPAWQLARTDANYAARCGFEAFELPPEAKWPAIVPTLRLVHDEVLPVVGRVEVFASNRSAALNTCVRGAKGSRHLAFAAVDLIAPAYEDKRRLFSDLCAMHRRVGPRTAMGLGAYYDPEKPRPSRLGRFHLDASGYRTWGFDYTRSSSGCFKLG